MILANGCNITKSEKFKGVWILSVPTVYFFIFWEITANYSNTVVWSQEVQTIFMIFFDNFWSSTATVTINLHFMEENNVNIKKK